MTFPVDVTCALTGVTPSQLRNWRYSELLVPEISDKRPPLYSFRDLVALRTVARLRTSTSLQKVRRAFATLAEFDLTDHPAQYRFAVKKDTIAVWTEDGFMDLVKNPGQYDIFSLQDIFKPFTNLNDEPVVDFERPRPNLRVDARRLAGWPTIDGTRVAFDTIADIVLADDMPIEEVRRFYPSVSPRAAMDAADFAMQVRAYGTAG